MLRLSIVLSALSLVGMILIDRALGSRATFLNAWSMVERLLGRSPSAGESLVAQRTGALGEFVVVIAANVVIGTLFAVVVRLVARTMR